MERSRERPARRAFLRSTGGWEGAEGGQGGAGVVARGGGGGGCGAGREV